MFSFLWLVLNWKQGRKLGTVTASYQSSPSRLGLMATGTVWPPGLIAEDGGLASRTLMWSGHLVRTLLLSQAGRLLDGDNH